jgi:hypothetical protein
MEPREVAPTVRERQLFDQLTRLRREQLTLRAAPAALAPDRHRTERLRQIDIESTAVWTDIRAARAAARAEHRARFAVPRPDPFRGLLDKRHG